MSIIVIYFILGDETMNKKIGILIIMIIWAIYTIVNAGIVLKFSDINIQSLENKFSPVHFTAPGNNFGWSIFWLPSKSIIPTTIKTNSWWKKICTKLVRWLYFNSQRGKRLRPLDEETRQLLIQQNERYNNISIEWWLYTTCDSWSNYGIFWAITYTLWNKKSYIVAGTQLDYQNNEIQATMANNFQYFDNKIPLGYIYDSNGGIGYVGGSLTGHQDLINFLNNGGSINSWFMYSWTTVVSNDPKRTTSIESGNNATETMRNLIVQWSVGLSTTMNESERNSLGGNFQNKTVLYSSTDINSSTVINNARQKTQKLCQGKILNPDLTTTTDMIICYSTGIHIDLSKEDTYKNKTIIVKNGNITLEGNMNKTSPALDIFVDKWLVYLPDTNSQLFNQEWFPDTNGTYQWCYLKWNFIINGLVVWWTPGNEAAFTHRLHIQGKIALLNTPFEPSPEKITQIENMFEPALYTHFINLQNIFTRTCKLDGTSSDGTGCGTGNTISTTPLVILNGNYPSKILQ